MNRQKQAFHEYVMGDVLGGVSGVTSRAMFSGFGLYKDGIIFGIIAENELYFKVDDSNRVDYEKCGMKPFTYQMPGGKLYQMSYYQVPEEIREQKHEVTRWVQKAVEASLKGKRKKKVVSSFLMTVIWVSLSRSLFGITLF